MKIALFILTCSGDLLQEAYTEGCPEKIQPLLIYYEWFVQHQCNLAAEESGLECTCVNDDDFTALVSGGVDTIV